MLSGLAVAGMEYYISNTYDENDMTASINNNAFKIRFEAVEWGMQPSLLKRVKIRSYLKNHNGFKDTSEKSWPS